MAGMCNGLLVAALVISLSSDSKGSYYCNHRWLTSAFYPSNTLLQAISLNGPDSRDDLIAISQGSLYISDSLETGTFYHQDDIVVASYCSSTGDKVYAADIDGDLRDDLLCHKADGSFSVKYFMNGKKFADEEDFANGFRCFVAAVSPTNELLIGDFDGNNADDLMCISRVTVSAAGSQIYFNGACPQSFHYSERQNYHRAHIYQPRREKSLRHHQKHSHLHGREYISNQCSNDFPKTHTLPVGSFVNCDVRPAQDKLIVGDANGDGVDDFICHVLTDTKIHTYLGLGYTSGSIFASNSILLDDGAICDQAGNTIRTADVDGDGDEDLVCVSDPILPIQAATDLQVSYFNNNQYSTWNGIGNDCDPTNFCLNTSPGLNANPSYIVGDYNQDGKDDLMCSYTDINRAVHVVEIVYAQ